MAIIVDAAVWPWRDRLWAHLASDRSFDELHEFAQQMGRRRLGFQGDHYDIDEHDRLWAIELGAIVVDPRDLVRRLRAAGLRRRHDKPRWQRIDFAPTGKTLDVGKRLVSFGDPGLRLRSALAHTEALDRVSRSSVYADDSQLVALFDYMGPQAVVDLEGLDEIWIGQPRRDGERSVELFVGR